MKGLGNSLAEGISTGSVTGNYLERRQQHSELRSNDIILIQEHNQCGIVVSGIASLGAKPKNYLQNTCMYARF